MNPIQYTDGARLTVRTATAIKVPGNNRRVAIKAGDITSGVIVHKTIYGRIWEFVRLQPTTMPSTVGNIERSLDQVEVLS
jgi:hypothetical protein